MFTSFSDAVFDHLMTTVPAGAPVARQRLSQPDVPRPIGHFLDLSLQRRVALQVTDLDRIAVGWVDHRTAEVAAGREAFVKVLVENAQFPVDEWPLALRQAVERVVSHLVRPVPTLVHFLFGEESGPVERDDLLRRSRYFVAHAYLGTTAEALLSRTGTGPVNRRDLSQALERVERSVTSEWSTDDWFRALSPLLDLARLAELDGVPLAMLDAFFSAKDAPLLAARIHAYGKRKGRQALDGDEVRSALADATHAPGTEPDGGAARGAAPAAGGVPLWQQFRPGTESPADQGARTESGEPLWKRFREPAADGDRSASLHVLERDVLGAAGEKRDDFVRDLFSGSEEEYGRILGRLRAATTWAAASRILGEDLFRKHKVDIYSPAAVDFTNAVENRYRRDS